MSGTIWPDFGDGIAVPDRIDTLQDVGAGPQLGQLVGVAVQAEGCRHAGAGLVELVTEPGLGAIQSLGKGPGGILGAVHRCLQGAHGDGLGFVQMARAFQVCHLLLEPVVDEAEVLVEVGKPSDGITHRGRECRAGVGRRGSRHAPIVA